MWAPAVDVVIPVRDGEAVLRTAVNSVFAQDYRGPIRIIIAVGPSSDQTAQVANELSAGATNVSTVDNPSGRTPVALNLAIDVGRGEVIVRLDAQSQLPANYIARAVELLEETGAVNVGGVQRAVGSTPFEQAVAAAMNSRLGAGDARFRVGGPPGEVDTVYLGVFRRDALVGAGGFDPGLVRNQDYELNWRLRQRGGTIFFHPDLEVGYRPRGSLSALARQYFEYGRWKREVLRRHPRSVRWRQLVPPIVVVANVAGLALSAASPWTLSIPSGYVAAIILGSLLTSPVRATAVLLRLPLVLATMHHAWGLGFLMPAPRPVLEHDSGS